MALRAVSLVSAFAALPLIQAGDHIRFPHSHFNLHRRQSVPTTLPGNWTSKGCVTDNPASRTLAGATFVNTTGMTVESCIDFCDKQSFIFAGVEFAQECYCDNRIESGGTNASISDCNLACTGNSQETCGAGNRLNLFWSGAQPPPPPMTVPNVGNWTSLGCYNDTAAARTLPMQEGVTGNFSVESCTAKCFSLGQRFAGMEFADECYCGSAFENGGAPTPLADCNMVCAGNDLEFCGGPNRLNVYNYTGDDLPPPVTNPPPGGGGNTGAPVFTVNSGLPEGWNYSACFVDNAFGRIFSTEVTPNPNNTVETCIAQCIAQNFTIAGVEFSDECYCGNDLVNAATTADISTCNMGCAGNATEACGGPNRLSVYSSVSNITIFPVPVAQNTSLPGQWVFQGCLREPGAARVFPYQNFLTTNNSATNCLTLCSDFGYPAAGMEFGDECWCGDVADITNNGGVMGDDSECTMPCSGDPDHLCGGAERLQLYEWNGNLNVWHTPDNIGFYEFFVPGVVVPLIATVGVNNKVTFLEKDGTSEFDNSTGAYELDLSLASNFSAAWRTMHVKSDVFCSGSIILPDKGGRQINVGGWSLDSTFGVRLYTPDGSPGVNGTNDWEENGDIFKLQRGRWYPSALLLANGSILVMGGETGSNGPPQPNMEIMPQIPGGDTVIDLDFLNRTDPNNLYPFLFVLPSGNVFVGYYNEARILDQVTFDTVKQLPNIPAAVNNFLGGRTYPMEGAAVLFPQHAPYTEPVTVLICGGSTMGASIALDNCVSTQPEIENATWTLERMPSKRVMSCMVPLPDGTFMIMNGAQQGVAGFGLADDPNLTALLYDPTLPAGQRMSILNTTIVARLYHSEAILLPDGRVLISGSDPQTKNPDGSDKFPEEMRIEVYVPPYLNQGFTQPTYNLTETDWAYGGQYHITNIHLFQGATATLRVSLVAAVSSTHGNSMGSRTIFPEFACTGTSCTVTAPPNANVSPPGWHQLFILDGPTPSHSTWVRIGGDPAQLGNWPQLPGFTTPGV